MSLNYQPDLAIAVLQRRAQHFATRILLSQSKTFLLSIINYAAGFGARQFLGLKRTIDYSITIIGG
jgi:hypothetical protein